MNKQPLSAKVEMESRAVIHNIPRDGQVALATFRSLDATMLFVKGLPVNDMQFPDLCIKAGATDIAGALTMSWVKFPTPDHACYFAMEIDQMDYQGKTISISAGRVRNPRGFKDCIQRVREILTAMDISLNYYLSLGDL